MRCWRRWMLNGFIALHLFALVIWLFPCPTTPLRDALLGVVGDYISVTGLWQSWDLFAPDPLCVNARLQATVQMRDGTVRGWPFAGTETEGVFSRYLHERSRKWRELLGTADYRYLWPDTCRQLARAFCSAENPPVKVTLVKFWQVVPEPRPGDDQPLEHQADMERAVLYEYAVLPGDLR